MKPEYRIIKFYNTFFAHYGYRLQRKVRLWRWSWWETIEEDNLGIHGNDWSEHYDCSIIMEAKCEIKKG